MMRLSLFLCLLAGPAMAHPGHLAGLAGHDHWVAGAAIGLAIGLSAWAAWKHRGKKDEAAETEADGDDAPEEQTA